MRIEHSTLRQLFAYWQQKRSATGAPPQRADLDPVLEIPRIVHHMSLLDVIDGGLDFRFRLAGGEFREIFGRELRGARISDLNLCTDMTSMIAKFRFTARHAAPDCFSPEYDDHGFRIRYECLACPLARASGTVDMLLLGAALSDRHKGSY